MILGIKVDRDQVTASGITVKEQVGVPEVQKSEDPVRHGRTRRSFRQVPTTLGMDRPVWSVGPT